MITIPIAIQMPSEAAQAKLARLALANAERGQHRTFVRIELAWGPPRPGGEVRQLQLSFSPCDEDEASFAIEVEDGALAARIGDDEG